MSSFVHPSCWSLVLLLFAARLQRQHTQSLQGVAGHKVLPLCAAVLLRVCTALQAAQVI